MQRLGPTIRACMFAAASALVGRAVPAAAHHSTAMFDNSRQLSLTGTVKSFQWTNPHAWLQLLVAGPHGTTQEWGVEMGAPLPMLREGWNPTIVKPGDTLTVTVAPLRDGSQGGMLVGGATRPDGSRIGRQP